MAYYYLISSLPMLKADGSMPLSYDQFLILCRDVLGDAKYALLKDLSLSSVDGPLVKEWAKYYGLLHEELTYQRNVRLGRKTAAPSYREESIVKLVSAAMNHKNPLAAEEMLLAWQFEKLDELVGIHYFDDYALIGYALKLKLLERKQSFIKEDGKAEFGRIVGNLEHQIMSMEQE
ncbi:MAG: DUF2764 family protein [Clostridia bacterium]|nr:DUF2764 family protein [Clostridia bacterium]